ncbi:hypothetical protein ACLOJK_036977, partial [Asimina triloba]
TDLADPNQIVSGFSVFSCPAISTSNKNWQTSGHRQQLPRPSKPCRSRTRSHQASNDPSSIPIDQQRADISAIRTPPAFVSTASQLNPSSIASRTTISTCPIKIRWAPFQNPQIPDEAEFHILLERKHLGSVSNPKQMNKRQTNTSCTRMQSEPSIEIPKIHKQPNPQALQNSMLNISNIA